MKERNYSGASNALHIFETGEAKIERVKLPMVGKDDVLVEPKFWGVCGSDLKLFNNTYAFPHTKNIVPGHEWVGYVSAVGENVQGFAVGDRVTGECSAFCDSCFFCQTINKNLCKDIQKHGITKNGFAAQHVIVDARYLHSINHVQCEDELCVFIEPLAVVLQGLKEIQYGFENCRNVLILGAGTIGLLTGLSIKNTYPGISVTIIDNNQERLEIAAKLSLIPIQSDLESCSNHLHAMKFDMMIESSGYRGFLKIVESSVRQGGHILLFTMSKETQIPTSLIVKDMMKFHGNLGGAGSFPEAIRLLASNTEEISLLVDDMIDFDFLPNIINGNMARLNRGVKTIIRM